MKTFVIICDKDGNPLDLALGGDGLQVETVEGGGARPPNLKGINAAKVTSHGALNTAEKMDGFTAGATVEVVGLDTRIWVGSDTDDATSKTAAETHTVGSGAGVPIRVTLDPALTALHIDAATGGAYMAHQVS